MTVEELYANIEGDYNNVIRRLGSDALVGRFVAKVMEDESFKNLCDAWAAGDERMAFRAAHTAKGVYANLSLTKLAALASQITEALREGNEDLRATTDVDALVKELTESYNYTAGQIQTFVEQS